MILLALGSNLAGDYPDCVAVLRAACAVLQTRGVAILKKSSLWLTEPVPVSDQPWYHNAVIHVSTDLSPKLLLSLLKAIEAQFGTRAATRNAPRVLDMDILAYNDVICTDNAPVIPHPRLQSRGFVLFPLQEAAPEWIHPVFKTSVSQMISDLESYPHIKRVEGKF